MADEIVPRPDDEPQSSASPISNTGDRWSVREQQKPKRRRRVLPLFFVLISLVALLGVTTVAGYYGATRRPVTELPGVATITRSIPPRLLFSFAGVASPVGIAASPDGQRIYVSEGGGERLIKVFNREGRLVDELTAPETKPGQRKPGFLALDTKGRLYASDRIRNTVDVFAPALQAAANPLPASTRWDSAWQPALIAQMGGWVPNGISVGADGRLYVTEIGQNEHSVLVFGADGTLADRLAKSANLPDGLKYPVQAAADQAGRIYVTDGLNGRVLAIGPRGVASVGVVGEEAVALPLGLAVEGDKLYVADAAGHRITVYAVGDRPSFLHSFGDSDDDNGMAFPAAVAADRAGRVYVADRANHRVQVWTY